jgi:hypothetical protein
MSDLAFKIPESKTRFGLQTFHYNCLQSRARRQPETYRRKSPRQSRRRNCGAVASSGCLFVVESESAPSSRRDADLILRACEASVSKDGRESVRCLHPSRHIAEPVIGRAFARPGGDAPQNEVGDIFTNSSAERGCATQTVLRQRPPIRQRGHNRVHAASGSSAPVIIATASDIVHCFGSTTVSRRPSRWM